MKDNYHQILNRIIKKFSSKTGRGTRWRNLIKIIQGIKMKSLKELYRIGLGPSSSHTIGPSNAAIIFKEKTCDAYRYMVILYGSLAATGKGHLTDYIIQTIFSPVPCEIVWKKKKKNSHYILTG